MTWAYPSRLHEEFGYPNLDGIIADLRTAPRNPAGIHVDGPLAGDLACGPETGFGDMCSLADNVMDQKPTSGQLPEATSTGRALYVNLTGGLASVRLDRLPPALAGSRFCAFLRGYCQIDANG